MNCEPYQNIMDALLDGTATEQQKQQLRTHIETCSECREVYHAYHGVETVVSECFTPQQPSAQRIRSILTAAADSKPTAKTLSIGSYTKIAAGILLIAAVGLGFMAGRSWRTDSSINAARTAYQIRSIEGTVLVRHTGSQLWKPIAENDAIYEGDEFLSTPNAKAIIAVDKNSTITLNQNSMLVLKTTGENTELYLANGTLDASLESPHGPFFVTTPHGRAEALGTEFTINVE